jgi:Cu/Ag efflux protein CusF
MMKRNSAIGLALAGLLLGRQAIAQTGSGSSGSSGTSHDTPTPSMGSGTGSTSGTGSSGTSSGMSTGKSSETGSTMGSTSADQHHKAITGTVEKLDKSKHELTLSGTDKKLKLDSKTSVMKNGEHATLDDVKEGDQVRASYSGSADHPTVTRIDVMPGTGSGSSSGMSEHPGAAGAPTHGSTSDTGQTGEKAGSHTGSSSGTTGSGSSDTSGSTKGQ